MYIIQVCTIKQCKRLKQQGIAKLKVTDKQRAQI